MISLSDLNPVLEKMSAIGVSAAVLEPINGLTRIRAANDGGGIVIYDTIDRCVCNDATIGIGSITGIVSRASLFDSEKSVVEYSQVTDNIDGQTVNLVNKMTFKEGRRKADYRCDSPNQLHVPKVINDEVSIDDDNRIVVSENDVKMMNDAIRSITSTGSREMRNIRLGVKGGALYFRAFDGESDEYQDMIEVETKLVEVPVTTIAVPTFKRVLGIGCFAHEDFDPETDEEPVKELHLTIKDSGIVVVDCDGINALLPPIE